MHLCTLFLCTMDTMKPNEAGEGQDRYDEDLAAGEALEICNDSFVRRWHDADCTDRSVYSKDELKNELISLYETIRGFNAVLPFPLRLYVAKALEAEGMLDGEAKSYLKGLYPAEDWEMIGSYANVEAALKKKEKLIAIRVYMVLYYTSKRVWDIIRLAVLMRQAPLWESCKNARQRANFDREHTDKFSWKEGGHQYFAAIKTYSDSTNIHVLSAYRKDGVSTDLEEIFSSHSRLDAELRKMEEEMGIKQ